MITRREVLQGLAFGSLISVFPSLSLARSSLSSKPLVWITLRGAMDGLNVVVPYGDKDYAGLRPNIGLSLAEVNQLDDFFGLHPALQHGYELYKKGQASFIHACATGYRERSHFDGQKVLENGTLDPMAMEGWLNRYLSLSQHNQAIAIDSGIPLIVRGQQGVSSWYPHKLRAKQKQAELLRELFQSDAELGENFDSAMAVDAMASSSSQSKHFNNLMSQAGKFLSTPEGPNVAVLELSGFDTHSGQGSVQGRLASKLRQLDKGLLALQQSLGERWSETIVIAASEFGRTAKENGTKGTDHGTGNALLLFGGALNQSKVTANWPGLSKESLYQERDLAATMDIRSILKGVLIEHMGATQPQVEAVFPDSVDLKPLAGVV
jgi:uncharacterized protein (DUF1501 family)